MMQSDSVQYLTIMHWQATMVTWELPTVYTAAQTVVYVLVRHTQVPVSSNLTKLKYCDTDLRNLFVEAEISWSFLFQFFNLI